MKKKTYECLIKSKLASQIYLLLLSRPYSLKGLSMVIYGNPRQKKNIYKYLKLFKGCYIKTVSPTKEQIVSGEWSKKEIFYRANFQPLFDFIRDTSSGRITENEVRLLQTVLEENRYELEEGSGGLEGCFSNQNEDAYPNIEVNAIKFLVFFCFHIRGIISNTRHSIDHGNAIDKFSKEFKFYEKYESKENVFNFIDILEELIRKEETRMEDWVYYDVLNGT